MVTKGESKIWRTSERSNTLYLTIPSKMASDSQCPLKSGDTVELEIINVHDELKAILIKKKD